MVAFGSLPDEVLVNDPTGGEEACIIWTALEAPLSLLCVCLPSIFQLIKLGNQRGPAAMFRVSAISNRSLDGPMDEEKTPPKDFKSVSHEGSHDLEHHDDSVEHVARTGRDSMPYAPSETNSRATHRYELEGNGVAAGERRGRRDFPHGQYSLHGAACVVNPPQADRGFRVWVSG